MSLDSARDSLMKMHRIGSILLFTISIRLFLVPTVTALTECTPEGICSLTNFFGSTAGWPGQKPCQLSKVFFPQNEDELIAAVAEANRRHQKVKVASKLAHTYTQFACPNSDTHPGVVITTSNYNSSIMINKALMEVTADAGVQLHDLVDHLANEGLALPQATYWDGVSISGMISTGAHGSSLWNKGGGTYEYVVAIRFVVPASPSEGYAKIVTLRQGESDFEAARISLGVLGAVSKVTFSVQPMFKRSITFQLKDDDYLEEHIVKFGTQHEFADITWYPASKKVVLRIDDRVPANTHGDGVLQSFSPLLASTIKMARETEEFLQATKNASAMCGVAQQQRINSVNFGSGLLNDGQNFTGYPVVGFNNKMQTSGGCQRQYDNQTNLASRDKLVCIWDYSAHGIFYYEIEAALRLSQIKDFIKDVKRLRDQEPHKFCGIDFYYGILMRYVKASSAYLGSKEDVVATEFSRFRDRRPFYPQPFEDVAEELEQLMFKKYSGRPHFGKNRPVGFTSLGKRVRNLRKFLEVKRRMDPKGLFSSDWSDAVLGIRGDVVSKQDRCALEGLCFCEEDKHCAPEMGYYCRPGTLYKDARVCKSVEILGTWKFLPS